MAHGATLHRFFKRNQKSNNMSKQTAVSILVEQIGKYDVNLLLLFNEEIEQSKELEKNQIVEAYQDGRTDQHSKEPRFYNRNSEYYYSQKYNQ